MGSFLWRKNVDFVYLPTDALGCAGSLCPAASPRPPIAQLTPPIKYDVFLLGDLCVMGIRMYKVGTYGNSAIGNSKFTKKYIYI